MDLNAVQTVMDTDDHHGSVNDAIPGSQNHYYALTVTSRRPSQQQRHQPGTAFCPTPQCLLSVLGKTTTGQLLPRSKAIIVVCYYHDKLIFQICSHKSNTGEDRAALPVTSPRILSRVKEM
ncbi:hypothetical protein WMY93_000524 [Mugilogobius chulae]|uniref:Uncharacterized protein n=1 Tax=Mugilogobius chulae TaxID=88201 RepID=A0AAW0PZL0_9GOBI